MTQVGVGESIEGGGLSLESGVGPPGRRGPGGDRRPKRKERSIGMKETPEDGVPGEGKLESRGRPQMVEGSALREKWALKREEALEGRRGPRVQRGPQRPWSDGRPGSPEG